MDKVLPIYQESFTEFCCKITEKIQHNRFPQGCLLWKGIRVAMLFDLLTCIMQCCYIQCMIIQCLIFLLQFQFDFITFHFFFLQSCFRAFDICPSSMQDFHCAMRYAILRSTIIHTPFCHSSYFIMPSLLRLCSLQLYIQMALHSCKQTWWSLKVVLTFNLCPQNLYQVVPLSRAINQLNLRKNG